LEIAFAIPHLQTSGYYGLNDFLPGLLVNYEMTQRSNPALETCKPEKDPLVESVQFKDLNSSLRLAVISGHAAAHEAVH
jgi:hypothetical protein